MEKEKLKLIEEIKCSTLQDFYKAVMEYGSCGYVVEADKHTMTVKVYQEAR